MSQSAVCLSRAARLPCTSLVSALRCRRRFVLCAVMAAVLVCGLLSHLRTETVQPVTVPDHTGRLLDTPGCVIPEFSMFEPTVAEFIAPMPKLSCSSVPPLTSTRGQVILVEYGALRHYGVHKDSISCCAQTVTRLTQDRAHYDVNADNRYNLSDCHEFTDGRYQMPHNLEAAVVRCIDTSSLLGFAIYKNVHYFLPRDKVRHKIRKFQEVGGWAANADRMNVIIFGTDSVSRLNLHRHLPKTFKWLQSNADYLDFQGYNKLGDNTAPNLMPLLQCLHPHYMDSVACHNKSSAVLDDCPLIWKKFSGEGYVTVLGEDAPALAMFHNNRPGYLKQPTDFYNRAGFLASEKAIARSTDAYNQYFHNCQGPKPSIKVIHDYVLKALDTFRDVPVFGLFWSSGSSHEYIEEVSSVDDYQLEFLTKLKSLGHLNNTAVFFMSDHGLRFGKIRSTYIGSLEERLPYMHVLLPPWFVNKFPSILKQLKVNTKRLVTNFDFYHTIKDILHRNFGERNGDRGLLNVRENPTPSFSEPTDDLFSEENNSNKTFGHSLFEVVSPDRTCDDVGIPIHFCTCLSTSAISVQSQLVRDTAHFVIHAINSKVRKFPLCQLWRLNEVLMARAKDFSMSTLTSKGLAGAPPPKTRHTAITVTISAEPGGARFEATVGILEGNRFKLTAGISRITRYDTKSIDLPTDSDSTLGGAQGGSGGGDGKHTVNGKEVNDNNSHIKINSIQKNSNIKKDCIEIYKNMLEFNEIRQYCYC